MAVSGAPPRAPYAADPSASRGRLHAEPPSATRSDFRRDCDRIIHSSAFRRLAYKTQVFVYHEGDHYRTRLTHTLEVTQIARSLARALGLDEDLAEACALAHDLGHPPFGHSGERALDSCLAAEGGFDHNAQTLAVVTRLERRYAGFDGLNLTWETLEGLVKHNGPLIDAAGRPTGSAARRGVAREITEYSARQDLRLAEYPSAEAQAGAIADDIAYDAHDIDDGLRAAMFGDRRPARLAAAARYPRRDRRAASRPLRPAADPRAGAPPDHPHDRGRDRLLADSASPPWRRPRATTSAARGAAVVAFSPAMAAADRAIKDFLFPRMYRHPRVMRIMGEAEAVVRDLFARYQRDPGELPWRRGEPERGPVAARARSPISSPG